MKRLKYFLIPLVVVVIFAYAVNKIMYRNIMEMFSEKDMYSYLHNYDSFAKDKGIISNDYLMKRGYILLMGSSELGHSTWQHPETYFNRNRTKSGVITVGRAYNQSLTHTAVVASTPNSLKDKKVVLLLSMQWFMAKDGVTSHHFLDRFSPLQFYTLIENPKIKKSTKKEYVKRVNEVLSEEDASFDSEYLYSTLYLNDDPVSNVLKVIMKPYFEVRKNMLKLQDKGMTAQLLAMAPNKQKYPDAPIDWKWERETAVKDAKVRVGKFHERLGKHRLYIDKGYYRKYIHKKEDFLRGYYDDVDLMNSKEYTDFKIFLDVCRDLGIKPTVVVIPGMPQYYDFVGIDKVERDDYYKKVDEMINSYGFRSINLSKFENERYYLKDVMHLGTLGWEDVCERLYNIYEK